MPIKLAIKINLNSYKFITQFIQIIYLYFYGLSKWQILISDFIVRLKN